MNNLKTFFIAISKFFVFPAHLAENIPGLLFNAEISIPESSDMHTSLRFLDAYYDLIFAFS